MNAFYAKHGIADVLGKEERGASRLFRKWCFRGYIQYLGHARNVTRTYAKKPKLNTSFLNYLAKKNLPVPQGFRMAESSPDAMFKSFSKYDKGEPALDEADFLRACNWTERRYDPIIGGSKVLSEEEVLVEIDKSSSCGYPWNILYLNKTELLASAHKGLLSDFWDEIGKPNCSIQAIWKVAQKSEMLPSVKVDNGKIRTFTAAPIELSVASCRLFLDQNQKMNDNNILNNPSSTSFVGGSKFAGGWNRLYNHADRLKVAYELDESSYDASVFRRLLEWLADVRYRWIDKTGMSIEDRETLYRKVLHIYRSIIFSLVVLENGEVVLKFTGNPSGSTNTVNDNTLALDVLFNYAWIRNCRALQRETCYEDFSENVCPVFYGDDNTYTCSEEVIPIICPQAVKKVWDQLGVVTNTPDDNPRCLVDVKFLSASFFWDKGSRKHYPVPDHDKVLCSLLHASKIEDVRWHYLRACALRVESYWDLECREIISGYIGHLERNYVHVLNGQIKEIKWENIRSLYMTDLDIELLYSGKQCSTDAVKIVDIIRSAAKLEGAVAA